MSTEHRSPSAPLLAGLLRISTESYGLLMLLLSAMLFSTMGSFIKLAAATGLPSTELVFLRAVFQGSLVIAAMAAIGSDSEAQGRRDRALLRTPFGGSPEARRVVIARGAIGGFGFVCYFYTIAHLPLGDAVTLLSLHPAVTVFAAAALLGEPVRPAQLVSAAASATGAVLIVRPSFVFGDDGRDGRLDGGGGGSLGYLTAFLGTCCASAVFVLVRKAGKVGAHTLQLLFSWAVFGVVFSPAFGRLLAGADGGAWHLPPSPASWGYVLGVCSVGSAAHFLMNHAGRITRAGLSSLVRSSDIMWSYLWQVLVFGDLPRTSTMVGVALICASLAVIAAQKVRDEMVANAGTVDEVDTLKKDGFSQDEIELHVDYGSTESSELYQAGYAKLSAVGKNGQVK